MSNRKRTEAERYYITRFSFRRRLKRLGHQLSLAMTEEDDARLWQQYKTVLEKWHMLKKPAGVSHSEDAPLKYTQFLVPVFNVEYVALTKQLKAMYTKRSAAASKQQRQEIDEQIRAIKQKRYTVTTYYDRETGEEVKPGFSKR